MYDGGSGNEWLGMKYMDRVGLEIQVPGVFTRTHRRLRCKYHICRYLDSVRKEFYADPNGLTLKFIDPICQPGCIMSYDQVSITYLPGCLVRIHGRL